jgi:predicted transcriptional regulator
MRTISLKSDEVFYDRLTHLAKQLSLSKSELIRKAVTAYEETARKRQLKDQMRAASLRVREASINLNAEMDDTLLDGLDDV